MSRTETTAAHPTPELTEANDPLCLSTAEMGRMLATAPWRRLAVLGDSTAAGTGDPWPGYAHTPWADRLAAGLQAAHPDTAYLNTGKHGATLDQVHVEQMEDVLTFRPDLVHISCGGNNMFDRDPDFVAVERQLDELCSVIGASGAQLSMFTFADAFEDRLRRFRPRFVAFADIVRRVAGRHHAILTELWDHPARLRRSWLSADQLHLSMAGHAVAAAEVSKSLSRALR